MLNHIKQTTRQAMKEDQHESLTSIIVLCVLVMFAVFGFVPFLYWMMK